MILKSSRILSFVFSQAFAEYLSKRDMKINFA